MVAGFIPEQWPASNRNHQAIQALNNIITVPRLWGIITAIALLFQKTDIGKFDRDFWYGPVLSEL
jgi:hypothetical protein